MRLLFLSVGMEYISDIDVILNPDNYSEGELSLFNIARVICRGNDIIFLDEMNAKIDPVTSIKILEIINEFADNKTVISINHYGDSIKNSKVINLSLLK